MIYILEDDASIRKLVVYTIQSQGMEAEGFERPSQFWEALEQKTPELVLLDIMLPEEDGLQVLKRLRSLPATKGVPIIMLTAKSTEYDKVLGLDEGADDYVAKPFGMMELMARIRAALRKRSSARAGAVLSAGPLEMDVDKHSVTVKGQGVELTKKEFDLLHHLLENKGRVLSREALLDSVWGFDFVGETNSVDVYIRFLRSKIDEAFGIKLIHTVRGVGYVIRED